MSFEFTGKPGDYWDRVKIVDVVLTIRNLRGPHTLVRICQRYGVIVGDRSWPDAAAIGHLLEALGLRRHPIGEHHGWTFDPEWLAERWPLLPWAGEDPPVLRLRDELDDGFRTVEENEAESRERAELANWERAERSLAGPAELDFRENPMG